MKSIVCCGKGKPIISYEISTFRLFSSGVEETLTFFKLTLGSKFVITVSISLTRGSIKSSVANSKSDPVSLVPTSFLKNTSPIFILTRFCTARLMASASLSVIISFVIGCLEKDNDISLKPLDIFLRGTFIQYSCI